MALVATLIIPLSFIVSRVVVSKSQGYFKTQQDALGINFECSLCPGS